MIWVLLPVVANLKSGFAAALQSVNAGSVDDAFAAKSALRPKLKTRAGRPVEKQNATLASFALIVMSVARWR
ncbi:hypothetical protein LP415_02810 [Polaromonas sp. P1(28)-8]|nr:hypothetical protein LP415_02810 [Polaromonas sp. P1(28)-8]